MKFTETLSDKAVLQEAGVRIARYRLNKNLTQQALAREAGISLRTIIRIEHGESTQFSSVIRVLRSLHLLDNLEALIPGPAISPLQQLEMQGKKRQRASGHRDSAQSEPWSWGEET